MPQGAAFFNWGGEKYGLVRDPAAVIAACQRLQLPVPVEGKARLFSGQATGTVVQLPGWNYPVVFDTTTGQAHFDNYEGAWGDIKELHKLLQAYGVEKTRLEARRQGRLVREQQLPDGSIRLKLTQAE